MGLVLDFTAEQFVAYVLLGKESKVTVEIYSEDLLNWGTCSPIYFPKNFHCIQPY